MGYLALGNELRKCSAKKAIKVQQPPKVSTLPQKVRNVVSHRAISSITAIFGTLVQPYLEK
ncbi:MAG TPA: hypothetical protein V6D31_03005 [Candidatus Sericytochromatia bacterium]|jgi:hypothetical protein